MLQFGTAVADAVGFCIARAGHDKGILPSSTAETVGFGTAGISCRGHCRVGFGTAGILCCWALQEYSADAAGHCRGTAGIIYGWAPQEF